MYVEHKPINNAHYRAAFPNLLVEGNFTYYPKLHKKYLSDKWTF